MALKKALTVNVPKAQIKVLISVDGDQRSAEVKARVETLWKFALLAISEEHMWQERKLEVTRPIPGPEDLWEILKELPEVKAILG